MLEASYQADLLAFTESDTGIINKACPFSSLIPTIQAECNIIQAYSSATGVL